MTAFSEPWDASFEAVPADNEVIKNGAGEIRALKRDVREREAVDHSWAGDANDGKHLHATLRAQGGDPTLDPTDGSIYTKVISGTTEAFYKDSNNRVIQLTSNGVLNVPALPPTLPQLIATGGATASPNIDFVNLLSASFTSFELRFSQLVPITNGVNANLLFGTGGGPIWQIANYQWVSRSLATNGAEAINASSNDVRMPISSFGLGIPNGFTMGLSGVAKLFNAAANTTQSIVWETTQFDSVNSLLRRVTGGGYLASSTPITSLRIQAGNGAQGNWGTGRVELWGYP